MWIFMLEAALALVLLLFIVWWTLGPVRKRETKNRETTNSETPPTQETPLAQSSEVTRSKEPASK